jgi:hypothetical protein
LSKITAGEVMNRPEVRETSPVIGGPAFSARDPTLSHRLTARRFMRRHQQVARAPGPPNHRGNWNGGAASGVDSLAVRRRGRVAGLPRLAADAVRDFVAFAYWKGTSQ